MGGCGVRNLNAEPPFHPHLCLPLCPTSQPPLQAFAQAHAPAPMDEHACTTLRQARNHRHQHHQARNPIHCRTHRESSLPHSCGLERDPAIQWRGSHSCRPVGSRSRPVGYSVGSQSRTGIRVRTMIIRLQSARFIRVGSPAARVDREARRLRRRPAISPLTPTRL